MRTKSTLPEIRAVLLPFSSFGERAEESAADFQARAAERLRHRNRSITPWDFERITLDMFPEVLWAKCVPHARSGNWMAPGNVLLVVTPRQPEGNPSAAADLEPRFDVNMLNRIASELQNHAGMQVKVTAKNPSYQKVRVDLQVRLFSGDKFSAGTNYYKGLLLGELHRYLSPWADRPFAFGGEIQKAALLDLISRQPYVEAVLKFKLCSWIENPNEVGLPSASPFQPDALLISAEHRLDVADATE